MAAPNYQQIQSFNKVTEQLKRAAENEFKDNLNPNMTRDDVIDLATILAQKYAMLGCELGAQWYDLCTELAGVDVDPADLPDVDNEALANGARDTANKIIDDKSFSKEFNYYLSNVIENSIRTTGQSNLWRDYERGIQGGRWARVPVGDTCAWCLMLASQGAWYLTEKSAGGTDPNHYHDGCNCIAVYYADPESIQGYTKLNKYKEMYYAAEDAREANQTGKQPYDEELAYRIATAREKHNKKYEAGQTDKPWTKYNETLIVMRYQNQGIK